MLVIGHRGCPDHFPENTLAAIRGSAPHVDLIELDVRRCGSGEPVVFHDETLDRLTDASGAVHDLSLSELREREIGGSGEAIPTLEEALDAFPPDTGAVVELKHAGLHATVAPLLREFPGAVVVSSFRPAATEPFLDEPVSTAQLFAAEFEENLAAAAGAGHDALHAHYTTVDRAAVSTAHERGLDVWAWTVPSKEIAADLRVAGVDGVIVDSWRVVPDR